MPFSIDFPTKEKCKLEIKFIILKSNCCKKNGSWDEVPVFQKMANPDWC
jgi:hypothetical protein